MQDNWNSGIDPSFADKAWENMRKQLDEAMPVDEKQKRRAIGWWWVLGLGLLIAVASWLLLGNTPPQLNAFPILTVGKKAVAQLPEPTLSPEQGITIIEQAPSNIQQLTTPKPEITRAEKKQIHLQPPTVSSLATKASPDRQPAQTTNDLKENITVLIPLVSPLPATTTQNSGLAAANPATATTFSSPVPHDLIEGIAEIDRLAAKPLAILPLSFEKEIIPDHNNSQWLLEMGVSSRNIAGVDGIFAGVGYQWGQGHRKWAMGTGLYYRFQRLPFAAQNIPQANFSNDASQENSDALTASAIDLDLVTNEANFQVSNGVVSIPISQLSLVQKLHLVDIPFSMTYKIGSKLHLHSTLQISYLWKTFLDFDNRFVQERNLNQAFIGTDSSRYFSGIGWYKNSPQSSIGQNPSDFHRWQLGTALGLTYYPSSHLGIRLQYRSSLGNVYQSSGLHTYDYGLGTSLIWRFGGRSSY